MDLNDGDSGMNNVGNGNRGMNSDGKDGDSGDSGDNGDNVNRFPSGMFGGSPYSGGYSGGNVAAMYKQVNGQMAAVVEAAFVLILLVLVYYLYNGMTVSNNMKMLAYFVGGIYILNEVLVYTGKSGGVYGMVTPMLSSMPMMR